MLKAQSTGAATLIHGHLGWKCGPIEALGLWGSTSSGNAALVGEPVCIHKGSVLKATPSGSAPSLTASVV